MIEQARAADKAWGDCEGKKIANIYRRWPSGMKTAPCLGSGNKMMPGFLAAAPNRTRNPNHNLSPSLLTPAITRSNMKTSFDHEKLDVYQESIRFVSWVDD